jgi:hypothetical protein
LIEHADHAFDENGFALTDTSNEVTNTRAFEENSTLKTKKLIDGHALVYILYILYYMRVKVVVVLIQNI